MKSEHTLCKKKERHFIISIIIILIVLISGLFATTILGHSDVIKYNNKLVVDCCKMLPSEVGGAFNKYTGESYIQHGPEYPDGKARTNNQLEKLFALTPDGSGQNIRIIAKNDMVALNAHAGSNSNDPGVKYQSIKERFTQPLEDKNKALAELYQKYSEIRSKRRVQRILLDHRLESLHSKSDDSNVEKKIMMLLKDGDSSDQELSREYAKVYQLLEHELRKNYFVGNPLHTNRLSDLLSSQAALTEPFPDCVTDSAPFDFPPFLPFNGLRSLDPGSLFRDVVAPDPGVPGDPNMLFIPHVYVTAWGRGKTAWISGSWAFNPPTHIDLCGFALIGKMEIDGLVDNKSGSFVNIKMDAGITQYRVNKQWDEINPSVDMPHRNLRATCQDKNDTFYPGGYSDAYYGLHRLTPLSATIEAVFNPGTTGYEYKDGDIFFVGYWIEINVGDESFIQFSDSNRGTIVMHRPKVVFYIQDL